MTSPAETRNGSRTARIMAAVIVAAGVAAWAAACSTVETKNFSDDDCVAGGCASTGAAMTTTTTTGPTTMCTVDPGCTVSWGTDVFTKIIDGPAGCTATGLCHGDGKGGIVLETGKGHDAYLALKSYMLAANPGPVKPYIVPCDPQASGFTCNMSVDSSEGGTNTFGTCGSLMPLGKVKITPEDLKTIADWITCGAPEN